MNKEAMKIISEMADQFGEIFCNMVRLRKTAMVEYSEILKYICSDVDYHFMTKWMEAIIENSILSTENVDSWDEDGWYMCDIADDLNDFPETDPFSLEF